MGEMMRMAVTRTASPFGTLVRSKGFVLASIWSLMIVGVRLDFGGWSMTGSAALTMAMLR